MDTRDARSKATQTALMRAAEKLIADKGIGNASIRAIINAAGQKNESALQYHFRNLQGLISALHATRDAQIQERRAAHLNELLANTPNPSLRDICLLMVEPAFQLARTHPDFRRYIKAFGHDITVTDGPALDLVSRKGGASAQQTGRLLRAALPHLSEPAFRRRMDGALRFISASMVHHARQKSAFRGASSDLFLHSLIDALVGLLSAPESEATKAAGRRKE